MWPEKGQCKACDPCTGKQVKCLLDGHSVTQRVEQQMGGSSSKKHKLLQLEVWDSDNNMVGLTVVESEAQKVPELSMAKALWAIAHAIGVLVKEQVETQESERWQERLLQSLIDQVKSLADSLELFVLWDWFLQMLEMRKLEGSEEVETQLRPCMRKWKGKEPERNLE